MPRTAPELPSEIVREILEDAVDELQSFGPHNTQVKDNRKHILATYGLTCRYWAAVVRPILFESIRLRGSQDVQQLVELLDYDRANGLVEPKLADCVRGFELEVQLSALAGVVPHLHHLSVLHPRVPTLWRGGHTMLLCLSDTDAPAGVAEKGEVRSVLSVLSASLPRTLPGSIFDVHTLRLSHLRMRSLSDLVRAVESLPTIVWCYCDSLTFSHESAGPPNIAMRRARRSQLRFATSSSCGDGSLRRQLEICSVLLNVPGRCGLDADEWGRLQGLMLSGTAPPAHARIYLSIERIVNEHDSTYSSSL